MADMDYGGLTKDAYHVAREFTYYPIMSTEHCWFAVENNRSRGTYHQCDRYGREKVGPFPFCAKHASRVVKAINAVQKVGK